MMTVEEIKGLHMVELLSRWYGLSFSPSGRQWRTHSPFTDERDPSMFVRMVEGHWLFNDFSSGYGGSLIDFVQYRENLTTAADAIGVIRQRLAGEEIASCPSPAVRSVGSGYDLGEVYARIHGRDLEPCLAWLRSRGLGETLLEQLVSRQVLLLNEVHGTSYCCFAVRDEQSHLRCLDNHEMGGPEKFVLGRKYPFSLDYPAVLEASEVYVTEGIIDYLSLKELEGSGIMGVALLGNVIREDWHVLDGCGKVISALDDDKGGNSCFLDLQPRFTDKEIGVYDLEGSKDPNELLQKTRAGQRTNLSPERKVALLREFQGSANKSEVARKWGVDRSYVYELLREADTLLRETYGRRHAGRKPKDRPSTVAAAWERIRELEETLDKKEYDYQHAYAEKELVKVRLKWSEIAVSELRAAKEKDQKRQLKKKRKRSC